MSWEKANENCKNENAMLACFDSKDEAKILAQHCHDVNNGYGCWVGYQYKDGKSLSFQSCMLESIMLATYTRKYH